MTTTNEATSTAAVPVTASTPIEVPLTAAQLAPLLDLHVVTLLRWAREGRIPHRRLSARKVVFLPSEVRAWLSSGYAGDAVHAA